MGELRADVASARSDERRKEAADDLAQRRLERGDLLRREVGVQRAPVRRVLRRVEMERRPPAGERDFRHDVLHCRREERRIAGDRDDVVVAEQRPRTRSMRRCKRPGSAPAAS